MADDRAGDAGRNRKTGGRGRQAPGQNGAWAETATGMAIDELRRRLLDLTLSNQLLNFRLSDKSKKHIRLVDEVPSVLVQRMGKGGRMVFAPVPLPDVEPEDERTAAFREFLDLAKACDEEWLAAKAALGPRARRKEVSALERKLRDRCRAELGMEPWKPVRSAREQAEVLGISTSYDLPTEAQPENGRHGDGRLQTLFFPDELEAKLSGLYGASTSLEKDAGIQALYAGFGFLEWYQSRDSSDKLHAPLLLWPVAMTKDLVSQRYEYAIRGRDEDEAVNHSLVEKLKADFGLILPGIEAFADEESGAVDLNGWFAAVDKAAKRVDPRWRVCNWVVVGLMTFHKIAIWEDLDPAKWPADADPRKSPLLDQIFGEGEPWDGHPAREHDVDAVEATPVAPLLITDADSSQHSAVIDVMAGQNLVIQGPPGTGKSQTITNIISAALYEGKTVLFVSEKMAALEVVKSRLDDAGLGEFCLELHSDKASRAAVLGSLKRRMEMRIPPSANGEIAALRRKLEERKAELTGYVEKMNAEAGATGKTVHDIIWGHARTRHLLASGPRGLRSARFTNSLEMGAHDRAELERIARALEGAAGSLGDAARPSAQVWRGVGRTDITMFDAEEMGALAAETEAALSQAILAIGLADDDLGWGDLPDTWNLLVAKTTERPRDACRLPDRDVAPALAGLLDANVREPVRILRLAVERRNVAAEGLARIGRIEALVELGAEALSAAATLARRHEAQGLKPDDLRKEAAAASHAATKVDAALAALRKLGMRFGLQSALAPRAAAALCAALDQGFPSAELRGFVSVDLGKDGVTAALGKAKVLGEAALAAWTAIGDGVAAEGVPGATAARQAAITLRSTGLFGRLLSGAYRDAKATYRRMLPSGAASDRESMARALDAAVEWRTSLEEFEAFLRGTPVLRPIVRSEKEPFDALVAAAVWMEAVRLATPADVDGALEIRQAIQSADADTIQVLEAFQAAHGETLKALIESSPDTLEADTLETGAVKLGARAAALAELVAIVDKVEWTANLAVGEMGIAADFASTYRDAAVLISEASQAKAALGAAWSGDATQPGLIARALDAIEAMESWPMARRALERVVGSDDPVATAGRVVDRLQSALDAARAALTKMEAFKDRLDLSLPAWCQAEVLSDASFVRFGARCSEAAASPDLLPRQCALRALENEARSAGLGEVIDVWITADLPFSGVAGVVEAVWLHSAAETIVRSDPTLSSHLGQAHETLRRSFQGLDRKWLELNRRELAARLARADVPAGSRTGPRRDWTGRELIAHQCGLDRPSMHLRRLFAKGGEAIRALKPCLMMSPMSVARYLVAGRHMFDLVVIDEASQMRPEDAAGAMLRARQVVIVGDPKQLPPTSFFTAQGGADHFDEDAQEVVEDSILELSMRAWKPVRTLKWHYRSRHQSLIAYSNARFYDGRLIVFPSDRDRGPNAGVHLESVSGIYANGRNEIEAEAVVEAARIFMREHPGMSLGIVAMNQKQQELIATRMDRLYVEDPVAESYRRHWAGKLESTFVKNLENVQGDERDAIFISTVYGPDERGAFAMRFGPINLANGHRRLNVLFTRAKEMMTVFSSMDPAQIRVAPGSHEGVKVLKEYLDYARTGFVPVAPVEDDEAEPESEFERWFLERLRARGYEAVPQVGVKGYRIDIGIRHPDKPGRFIVGVECDGATYHSARGARDRDRLRQTVLERLGWQIHRVWSTDWFRDPDAEFETLLRRVEDLRASS